MLTRLEKKIQFIREQPEAVRMRYLFLYLFIAMFFIVIIWLFSLKESVSEISRTKVELPPTNFQDSTKSLQNLLNKDIPLQIKEGTPENGTNPLQDGNPNNEGTVIKNK